MKLTMLGTGNAGVINCYNTCFVIDDNSKLFLVDGGGGNRVLTQLDKAGYDPCSINEIFISHKHTDHIMGIIWMIRMALKGQARPVNIYGHGEVIEILDQISRMLFFEKSQDYFENRFHLIEVKDGETREINGRRVTFFDLHSTKTKQFGFSMELPEGNLVFCGDEPAREEAEVYAKGCKWLLHEAFCLYRDAEEYHPYRKMHSTVKDAAETAERLHVRNLLIYHTEEKNLKDRKELYTAEASEYYSGNIYVPEDLEVIEL